MKLYQVDTGILFAFRSASVQDGIAQFAKDEGR